MKSTLGVSRLQDFVGSGWHISAVSHRHGGQGRGGGDAVPLEWQTGVVVSSLKKGDQPVRSSSQEIRILGPA